MQGPSSDCVEEAMWGWGDPSPVDGMEWEQAGTASFVGGRLVNKNSNRQHLLSTYYMPGIVLRAYLYNSHHLHETL